jgi:hypothetical protein
MRIKIQRIIVLDHVDNGVEELLCATHLAGETPPV